MIKIIRKGQNIQLSKNFNQRNFDCKCNYNDCVTTTVNTEHVKLRQEVRDKWGRPVYSNSGYRCQRHNSDEGGVGDSTHLFGSADDLRPENQEDLDEFEEVCREVFPYVKRYETFCHCDVRFLRPR